MSAPVSFTIRPPTSLAPARPSPLGNGAPRTGNGHGGWKAPSQRMFDHGSDDDDDGGHGHAHRRTGGTSSHRSRPKDERVDGFANGRASGTRERADAPLVIAPLPNRDWRAVSARRAPSYRPEGQRPVDDDGTFDRVGDEPQRAGLRVVKREQVADDGTIVKEEVTEEIKQEAAGSSVATTTTSAATAAAAAKAEPLTLDEEALQAILAGEHAPESAHERLRRDLVIDMAATTRDPTLSEDDALRRDLDALPQESTLDDYAAVPVEAFGAAILRGMGYDPSKDTKVHVPTPRPALLGIGATPMSSELPGSSAAARKDSKKRREEYAKRGGRGYNAANLVVRRDTGSGATTPAPSDAGHGLSSRRTSPGTTTDSEAGRRRRRDYDDNDDDSHDSARDSKRRDAHDDRYADRDRDGRDRRDKDGDGGADYRRSDRDRRDHYETKQERAERKARERERGDRDRDRERYGSDRDRRDRGRDNDRGYDRRDRR